MIFRRKRDGEPSADAAVAGDDEAAPGDDNGGSDEVADETSADPEIDRSAGPFDADEVDDDDETQRIDLGAVQIPLFEGLEIRVEIDEESNQPIAVTLIRGEGAVQVRAFSAPRSGGTWAQARVDIRRSITGDGGTVDESAGGFGPELRANVPAQDDKGNRVLQPIRFVGVDGPRWMLQGVLLGAGSLAETAAGLEEVFRGIVVVRGDQAMPPGSPLPLSLPEQVPGDAEEIAPDQDDLEVDDR